MSSHESNELVRDLARTEEELHQIQRERDELDMLEEEARSLASRENRLAMLNAGYSNTGSEDSEEDAFEEYESMVIHPDQGAHTDIGTMLSMMWREGTEDQKRTLAALLADTSSFNAAGPPEAAESSVGDNNDSSHHHPLTLQDIAEDVNIGHVDHVLRAISVELENICGAHPYTRYNAVILEEFIDCIHRFICGPDGLQLYVDVSFTNALRRRVYTVVGSSVAHNSAVLLENVSEFLIDESVFVALVERTSESTNEAINELRRTIEHAEAQMESVTGAAERQRQSLFMEREERLQRDFIAPPPQ